MIFAWLFLVNAATAAIDREELRAELRQDAGFVILGILTMAVGLAAAAWFRVRRKAKDPALLWFALFANLYGMRLLAKTRVVPFTVGAPHIFFDYVDAAITYTIGITGTLFAMSFFPQWKHVIRWILIAQISLAIAGLASDQALGRPGTLNHANNVLVLAGNALFIWVAFRSRELGKGTKALRFGLLSLLAAVVAGNLAGLFRLGIDPEPIGFVIFLSTLIYVLIERSVHRDDELRSIQSELETARRIQLSILPREMPQLASLNLAARYVPMTAVAGDFYDFLVMDDTRIGILVADVSGHGVPAALIASMVKVAVAAQAGHADEPARVLKGMNQTLCGKMQGQFVTAAYLFLNLETRVFRYAAAGHPPLLWLRKNETVEEISENGLLLGMMPSAPYTDVERGYAAGDRFLLYTDGLLEAANDAGDFFGDEKIREVFAKSGNENAEDCATTLLRDLAQWAGHNRGRAPDDDLTIVVADAR